MWRFNFNFKFLIFCFPGQFLESGKDPVRWRDPRGELQSERQGAPGQGQGGGGGRALLPQQEGEDGGVEPGGLSGEQSWESDAL